MARKRKKKISFFKFLSISLVALILGYLAVTYVKQEIVLAEQEKQIEQSRSEVALLEEEFQKKLADLGDRDIIDYVDGYMRSHFGMVREGETRVVVVDAN